MKKLLSLIAVCAIISASALCACSDQTAGSTPPAEASVQTDAVLPTAAETAATAPTEEKVDLSPQGADNASDAPDDTLTGRWNLTAVYKDGEEQQIGVIYGSVIRQTGAYIELNDDLTFNCVLGIVGCQGDYTADGDNITLHITTDYDGTSDAGKACDEHTAVIVDRENNTLSFDYHNMTNTFAK